MTFLLIKLLNIKKEDTLVVYHGGWYSGLISLAKHMRKFQLIIEVEEIYTYAFNRNINGLKKELDFIKSADKLILVNDLICDLLKLDPHRKIVCYGPYHISNNTNAILLDNSKIHLVYAGSFSTNKGGVFNAIDAAPFLSDKYILHILGFGSQSIEDELVLKINKVNSYSQCKVIFHGQKRGDEYHAFMRGCNIGLNPQYIGDYMLYAYPSKTLAYLCFGLNVITSPLPALKFSELNSYFSYFETDSPKDIAKAITDAKLFTKEELKEAINGLNEKFIINLKNLIEL